MMQLDVDPSTSRVSLRIRAAGMLARLAPDLELIATEVRARIRVDGEAWSAELAFPVTELRVAGTLRGDRLVPEGITVDDRREVERRIRDEVLRGTDAVVV